MQRVALIALLAVLVVLGGCIDYQETISFNPDGSGTLKIRYALDKQYMDQMEQMSASMSTGDEEEGEEPESADDEMWTREQIEEALAGNDAGVELIDYSVGEEDGWKVWQMEFSFKNLADFQDATRNLLDESESEAGESDLDRSYTEQDDGTWLYMYDMGGGGDSEDLDLSGMDMSEEDSMEMPNAEEMAEAMKQMQEAMKEYSQEGDDVMGGDANPEEGEKQEQMDEAMENLGEGLESMFAGMGKASVKITATFPGKIIESNATSVEGNTATWEYKGQALMTSGVPMLTAKVQP